jgi:DNA-binding CsgD family transcriptional regulator
MVAFASRAALMGDETHDAWVAVFATIMRPPIDRLRAACPNCGFYAIDFRFIVDATTRIGMCALWCEHCYHGHALGRVRAPEGVDSIALDAPDAVVRAAVPDFYDAAAHMGLPGSARTASSVGTSDRATETDRRALLEIAVAAEQARDLLSSRERQIVAWLREGQTVAVIARELGIAPATVRSHVQRVYWKLGHTTRVADG